MSKSVFLAGVLLSNAIVSGQSLEGDFRKEGVHVRAAYDNLTEVFQASSAAIYDELPNGYGLVVSEDGEILVKASEFELIENPSVIVAKKRYRDVAVLATSPEWDVSLIKVEAEGLAPIEFADVEPEHGSIVLSNSSTSRFKRRAQLGVIAAKARAVGADKLAVLGIGMSGEEGEPVVISTISPLSGAKDAGLESGDEFVSIDGSAVESREGVPELIGDKSPGDFISVVVRRKILPEEPGEPLEVQDPFAFAEENPPEWEELEFEVELRERQEVFPEQLTRNDQMSGEFSKRRTNFPRVLQHDTSLAQRTTGGPLLTLDGKCVGMNIAFASRECTYAIPAKELQELIAELRTKAGL
jgi:hypothetical protein